MAAEDVLHVGFCPASVGSCVTPSTLTAINPADVPDELNQVSGSVGGPVPKDRTFFFAAADYTAQDRTTYLSSSLPTFVLPADGSLTYVGRYAAAVDHWLPAARVCHPDPLRRLGVIT